MIIAALVAASLVAPVAADPGAAWPPSGRGLQHMSAQQKLAVIRPLVDTANECIARQVTADPRFTTLAQAGEVNGLIVDSVPSCVDAMRALIDAHDRLFGEGAGETYFMGPYLDALPGEVKKFLNGTR
jgi:hypothetical protein